MVIERKTIVSEINQLEKSTNLRNIDGKIGDLVIQKLSIESDGLTFVKYTGYLSDSNKPKPLIEATRGKPFFYNNENVDIKNHIRWTKNKENLYVTTEVELSSRPQFEITAPSGTVFKRAADITGGPRNELLIRHIYKL